MDRQRTQSGGRRTYGRPYTSGLAMTPIDLKGVSDLDDSNVILQL